MDALTQLAPDLWVATRPLPLVVGDIGTRMTVIRLRDGSLFLHSPVKLDAETRAALDAIGPVRAVVAPSLVHHFYVGDYGTAYPQATLYAAPGSGEEAGRRARSARCSTTSRRRSGRASSSSTSSAVRRS